MTRMGSPVLDVLGADGEFVPCMHPWGCLSSRATTRAVAVQRREVHRPFGGALDRSYSSGYGGTPCLGRNASRPDRVEDRARRRLAGRAHADPRSRAPEGEKTYVAAAFPSACGRANFAMLIPPQAMSDWKVTTSATTSRGSSSARTDACTRSIRVRVLRRRMGTSDRSNPNAMASCAATRSSPTSP